MFKVWSIWEERNYIKLFPFVQLWELHQMIEPPNHEYTKYTKIDFNSEAEQVQAAKEFF